jgi:hypothetical protein
VTETFKDALPEWTVYQPHPSFAFPFLRSRQWMRPSTSSVLMLGTRA